LTSKSDAIFTSRQVNNAFQENDPAAGKPGFKIDDIWKKSTPSKTKEAKHFVFNFSFISLLNLATILLKPFNDIFVCTVFYISQIVR
jgi:hypothetical protein